MASAASGPSVGIARYVRFVHLHTRAIQVSDLRRQRIGDGESELREIVVVLVQQGAGKHVGTRGSELEWSARHAGGAGAVFGQVQDAFRDRASDDRRGLVTKLHFRSGAERSRVAPTYLTPHAPELVDEILDHSIGVGMIHIESIEFTVRRQIDARLPLERKHSARGVEQCLFAWQRREPVGDRIRTNGGGEDARRVAGIHFKGLWWPPRTLTEFIPRFTFFLHRIWHGPFWLPGSFLGLAHARIW